MSLGYCSRRFERPPIAFALMVEVTSALEDIGTTAFLIVHKLKPSDTTAHAQQYRCGQLQSRLFLPFSSFQCPCCVHLALTHAHIASVFHIEETWFISSFIKQVLKLLLTDRVLLLGVGVSCKCPDRLMSYISAG